MYSVHGRITANGRLLFATQQANQVLTQGHGSEIGMMTLQRVQSATGSTDSSAAPLQGTYWKLEAIGNQPVTAAEQQREPHLIFSPEGGRLTGSGGCNRLAGSYRTDGHTLQFSGIASTRMACMHGMEMESSFLEALGKVRGWKITGSRLELADSSGKIILQLAAHQDKNKS
jgi:putative lipoprotein